MIASRYKQALLAATALALTSSVSTLALAQDAGRTIADNGGLFIDARTFTVTPRTANGDVSDQIKALRARDIGPGAIIFRSGDKLYLVDTPPLPRTASNAQLDYDRQRPLGLRDSQLDYERQRPLGLRDAQLDYERQRPLGLRDDADYERQRPQGLRDAQLDYDRQRPLGLRDDADYERQRPLGYRDDADYERQRPRGLTDSGGAPPRLYIADPDYTYYRLKKTFEDIWGPIATK